VYSHIIACCIVNMCINKSYILTVIIVYSHIIARCIVKRNARVGGFYEDIESLILLFAPRVVGNDNVALFGLFIGCKGYVLTPCCY
jgi:hypothetical protein